MKIKKGDKVQVIAGKDKGKQGKILFVDRNKERVIIENVNMITKHQKQAQGKQAGIIKKEAPVHASNVMYLHKGEPTRIGYKTEKTQENGRTVTKKVRIAKKTGEEID